MEQTAEEQFNVDVKGRVKNLVLEKKNALLPVYEAVINSIQSCNMGGGNRISLFVERDRSQPEIEPEKSQFPISSIKIVDNGEGFTDNNYKSFLTSDTTNKAEQGGKGIGRFLWLKEFKTVHIESIYKEKGMTRKRYFDFLYDDNPIQNYSDQEYITPALSTTVILSTISSVYADQFPKSLRILSQKILEHCLSYFILDAAPHIDIMDDEDSIDLNALFDKEIKPNIANQIFDIKGKEFIFSLIRYYTTSEKNHRLFYCAHNREVRLESIEEYMPLLYKRFSDTKGDFIYLAYVSSTYLDELVNQERTGFNIPQETNQNTELDFTEVIRFEEIRRKIIEILNIDAEMYLKEIKAEQAKHIDEYVHSNAPEYAFLLKHRCGDIEQIPPGLSDQKLELELHKISQLAEREIKEKSISLISNQPNTGDEIELYIQDYSAIMDTVTDIGMANLAKYIGHRRMILQLLEDRLGKQDTGKFALEEAIHGLVFPLKATSDDSEYGKQNLWLIDEKLSYHAYLASDKSLKSIDVTDSESDSRPDIIVFNRPFAFTEDDFPYSSVVIIEFKRPVRDNYDDDHNPIVQVQTYIKEIKEHKIKDRKGRFIDVKDTTPFYGYIICDISPKLRDQVTLFDLFPTPDGLGYYWFNQNLKAYIEIISYDKLLSDAKKRNKVLFEKLGLPPTITR